MLKKYLKLRIPYPLIRADNGMLKNIVKMLVTVMKATLQKQVYGVERLMISLVGKKL